MHVSEGETKKVLIFSIAYFPYVGGAELAVKEITDRIKNFHFDLITFRFDRKLPKAEKIGNVIVYRVGGLKLFFPFIAFFKGLTLHKKYNHQIIWSVMANRAGFAALFFKFFHPDVKFLLTLQEGDVLDYPKQRAGILWPFVKFLFQRIFTKADYIQAISHYLANWAKNMRATCPIEVVPNGVDIDKFKSQISNLKSQNLKRELNLKSDDKIIITTSRLVEKNAVGDIIEALQYLPANIKLLILGAGPEEQNLKLKIKNLKLRDRVLFLGYISHKELPKYLGISDVFVRPSLSEGLGSSFLEAMAAGIPVIATPVGGIPDFLKNGETGLFCEVNNPKSIAEKVKILLENNDLREKIIKNAKEMVLRDYDWDLIVEKMKNIFNKLCTY